jgi:glycosyltransferase involved in cell wall biosynthesis
MLCATYGAGVIHLHNISGNREPLQEALPHAGVPYGYTVHDFSFACPTITLTRADGYYCGGVTDVVACTACLAAQRQGDVDIARWRERHASLLAGASFVIAPSRFAADLLRRYFPVIDPVVIPHGLPAREPRRGGARQVVLMPDDGLATIAVIGAVGPDKGSRRIERLAEHAARIGAGVRFVVVGYTDHHHRVWQSDDSQLTVHGRYDPRDLPWLLDHYGVRLVVFPSLGPETFAFTLTEAWAAGRAVLVPPIGALAERVDGTGAGWLMTDAEWRDDARLLERIESLVAPANAGALADTVRQAATLNLPTPAAMAAATVERYRSAQAARPVSHPPVDRLRVVEAYGFRRWAPPKARDATLSHARAAGREPVLASSATGLGDVAKRLRATAAGRVLYRLLPEGVRAALKSRMR